MILASSEMIREWPEKGARGAKTFIDDFKANVGKDSDLVCPVDLLPRTLVGKILKKKLRTDILVKFEKARASGARGVELSVEREDQAPSFGIGRTILPAQDGKHLQGGSNGKPDY